MIKDPAQAVGDIPSGLFIVVSHGKNPKDVKAEDIDGYLASWVQQTSFSPLRVSLAIRPGRPAYNNITSEKVFTINVVGDHETQYLRHFWSGHDPAKFPFKEIPYEVSENGGIILQGAKSVIECRMHEKFIPGDHELIIADVLQCYSLNKEAKSKVHTRKSGLDY